MPPSFEELKKRIAGRGTETEETMKKRLGGALHEMSFIDEYQYCVVNDDLSEAINEVKAIVVSEGLRIDESTREFVKTFKED